MRRGPMRAASLRHVGTAAAARAAELDGRRANQLDRVKAACQIWRDADDDAGFPVAVDADNRNDPGTKAQLRLIGKRFEFLHRNSGDDARQKFHAADFLRG